ncbi:Glypican [Trinorchestia longiramus]|nr:Glypican [Trinorchestia longiramus]
MERCVHVISSLSELLMERCVCTSSLAYQSSWLTLRSCYAEHLFSPRPQRPPIDPSVASAALVRPPSAIALVAGSCIFLFHSTENEELAFSGLFCDTYAYPNNSSLKFSGQSLEVCAPSEETCCPPQVETALSIRSRKQFDDALAQRLEPLAALMGGRRAQFDEMFFGLLNYSKTSFEEMFQKTYGMVYLQNARVFDDLYVSLESYYRTGRPDIGVQMNDFFKKFYQRMFIVYNSQYTFSDQYLACVLTYMDTLQPFGDVPTKFGGSIKRSFVALRTFVMGLNTSASVVNNLLKVNPSVSCVRELMRLTHCSTCQGLPDVRPCLPYCLHVHTHCLHHLQQFSADWKDFVDAMVTVGDRLLNPFNIENVVRPINLQISDAVMNFQVAGANISTMIFRGCGQPSLGRSRREADDALLEEAPVTVITSLPPHDASEATDNGPIKRNAVHGEERVNVNSSEMREGPSGNRRKSRPNGGAPNGGRPRRPGGPKRGGGRRVGGRRKMAGGRRRGENGPRGGGGELHLEKLDFSGGEGRGNQSPSLNTLIREIKTKLENSRQFLEELSPQLCGEISSDQDSSCWTGTHRGRSADSSLPELKPPPPHAGVHEQTYRLQAVTRLLQAAANGQDIAWIEERRVNDDSLYSMSDHGSGSGDWADDDWGDEETVPRARDPPHSRDRYGDRSMDHNFPPDDEDGYSIAGSGDGRNNYGDTATGRDTYHYGNGGGGGRGAGMYPSRYDNSYEGSGSHDDDYSYKRNRNNYESPYSPDRPPLYGDPNLHPNANNPPSGVAKEDMTLTKAITVYLIPAIIMYFGSIG